MYVEPTLYICYSGISGVCVCYLWSSLSLSQALKEINDVGDLLTMKEGWLTP